MAGWQGPYRISEQRFTKAMSAHTTPCPAFKARIVSAGISAQEFSKGVQTPSQCMKIKGRERTSCPLWHSPRAKVSQNFQMLTEASNWLLTAVDWLLIPAGESQQKQGRWPRTARRLWPVNPIPPLVDLLKEKDGPSQAGLITFG